MSSVCSWVERENAWKQRCQPKGSKSCERVAGCWCELGQALLSQGLNHHPRAPAVRRSAQRWAGALAILRSVNVL